MEPPFFSGNMVVVHSSVVEENGRFGAKVRVVHFTETGKLKVALGEKSFIIDPSQVILRVPKTLPATLKELLQGLWGNLVFGRVSRIVSRSQDLNIWFNGSDGNPESRKFLGDNKEVLKKFTREEIRNNISFEYDFFYGFCGALDKNAKISRNVPTIKKVTDRLVEEDLDDLCPEETEDDDDDDEKNKKGAHQETSFHFASTNFSQPLVLSPSFRPHKDLPFDNNPFTIIPPRLGVLVCGLPVKSKRGVSLTKWWSCPEAFFELWKLINSNRQYPENYSFYDDMKKLKWRQGKERGRCASPLNPLAGSATRFFFVILSLLVLIFFAVPLESPFLAGGLRGRHAPH